MTVILSISYVPQIDKSAAEGPLFERFDLLSAFVMDH